MAGLGEEARPHPPGRYPVVVVGSGPGGLQVSYCLSRLGVAHALISQDPEPAGMFRRFPLFERLITWTKPYAPSKPGNLSGGGNPCFLFIRATPTGFQYDREFTRPNQGIYNCSPKNLFTLPPGSAKVTTLADVGQRIENMK